MLIFRDLRFCLLSHEDVTKISLKFMSFLRLMYLRPRLAAAAGRRWLSEPLVERFEEFIYTVASGSTSLVKAGVSAVSCRVVGVRG